MSKEKNWDSIPSNELQKFALNEANSAEDRTDAIEMICKRASEGDEDCIDWIFKHS